MRGIPGLVLALSVCVSMICPTAALANCPAGYPNEIFCDDFDTYCSGGGYPGDPKTCVDSDKAGGNPLMREVWWYSSYSVGDGLPIGTSFTLEDDQSLINSPYHGNRYPSKVDLGQSTVRDWVLSPGQAEPVLDIHRLVANVFGPEYAAVAATDGAPLVMEFFAGAPGGKLFWSSGFMELAFGDETSDRRANTDYVMSPYCGTYCSPAITQGPFQIMCAQGNPQGALPTGCPPAATAPVHQTIAVGALSMMDVDPCHCGVQAHGSLNYHLSLYDGKLWWMLRSNTPRPSSGTVTPKDGAPMPPPEDVYTPGDFLLSSGERAGKSYNLVVLTIRTNTMRVELTSLVKSGNGASYYVYNVMDDIPRQYTGPFDRIRGGVSPGCALASSDSWETCAAETNRSCISLPKGYYVDIDDFVLHGGTGYTVSGACCLDNADCIIAESQLACEADPPTGADGRWQGPSTTCETVSCCPYPFADGDHDGDVDHTDFGLFQSCYTGFIGTMPDGCDCFNTNGNEYIDPSDFDAFSRCWTGPTVPWSEALAPNCNP